MPCRFIGQRVEVQQRGDTVHIFQRDQEIDTHAVLPGQHQFRILPEHGPGASARTTRQRCSTVSGVGAVMRTVPEVEIRDLACYEVVCGTATPQEVPR